MKINDLLITASVVHLIHTYISVFLIIPMIRVFLIQISGFVSDIIDKKLINL